MWFEYIEFFKNNYIRNLRMLGDLTSKLIDQCIHEIYKEPNREKIRLYMLDPCAKYIRDYIKPYMIALIIILLFILGILLKILSITHKGPIKVI